MKMDPQLLARTRQGLNEANVIYARTTETLFGFLRWISYLCVFWQVGILLIMAGAHAFRLSSREAIYTQMQLSTLRNGLYFSVITIVLLIAGYVFTLLKKPFVSCPMHFVTAAIALTYSNHLYAEDLFDNGMGSAFHYRHGFPLSILMFVSAFMFVIALRQYLIEKNAYETMLAKLYRQYRDRVRRLSDDGGDTFSLTDVEWHDFLYASRDDCFQDAKKIKKKPKKQNGE